MPQSKTKSSSGKIPLIDSGQHLAALARRMSGQPVIAFDTEFLWERTYAPRLGLIQIGDLEGVWLVDPIALSRDEMQPLLDVLVATDSLKVAHAIDQDQMCLHHSYGIIAKPVLDTSIAAALLGMGDQIGLSKLLERLLKVRINKGYSRTNWLKRPLPPKMLEYAAEDVRHLTKAAGMLCKRLRKRDREEWALDLSTKVGEFATAQFEPESVARRIAMSRRMEPTTFGVFRELIRWREREASRRNIPRRWLADDKLLVKLASARPTSAKALADFRGLGISKRPHGAARVLRAIRRGLRTPPKGYERPPRRKSPTPKESAALVVLRCFVNALAADKGVPVRLLMDSNHMVDLLRGRFKNTKSLRDSRILDPRVVDLVGDDLVAILNGQRGLRLVNGVATQQEHCGASGA